MEAAVIRVELLLQGGHSKTLEVPADAPELRKLFQILGGRAAHPGQPEHFFQLPLAGGTESFSFSSTDLVAISTQPPVVVEFEQPQAAPAGSGAAVARVHRPRHMIIDNFLGHYEHADMLANALKQEDAFNAGTVATGERNARENLAILDFAQQAHSLLLSNRLLTWMPQILQTLHMDFFPVHQVESQLTASNDGHYYRAHLDADISANLQRALTCVYYFSRQPAQFSGGALRIFDSCESNGERWQAEDFQQIEPRSNRMVIFPSDSYHELMPIRCPSRQFRDSRFAITSWIWRALEPEPEARHGWGHMRCGKVPENWQTGGLPQ